ncbi:fc01a46f-3f38-4b2c-b1cd-769be2dbcf80 [Thermothielavioides terrestris]|uniref:Acyl carrier protein n=1 Tax=Thermothielavioides terrestris TaxID=2587410 RepID=A0A3S4B7W2_9PEZI|nr:fc01a46f-3f38-4b2c-b1cd-769be2dbcf80 [Thermothielavioides terrestris]
MFRTAILRSAAAATRTAMRPVPSAAARRAAVVALPRTAPSFVPKPLAWQAVRCYASGSGLDRTEVYERIKQLLSGFDKVNDPANITETAHFANDLGLDSLDTVEVVMAIEEEFSIEIPDKDADTIHSGTFAPSHRAIRAIRAILDKAVEYILSQPDAN